MAPDAHILLSTKALQMAAYLKADRYFDSVVDLGQIVTIKTTALVATSYPPSHNDSAKVSSAGRH
jgi:hypothetical protein